MSLPFEILFEDVHLIVLNKPSGLLSQGEITGQDNVVDSLRRYLGRPYVGLIHRLDRNTSGLMVVAKRTKSADRLTKALQSGALRRSYLAWLEGSPAVAASPEKLVLWEDSLIRDEKTKITRVVRSGAPGSKHASLKLRGIRYFAHEGVPLTLCEFELETGRAHQIRAQASSRGFPLLGDVKYGARVPFHRLALHSHHLEFPHPMSGEIMKFQCPLPEELNLKTKK
ncbi:MAG: RluA family pseudouridine synthase [Bdellovibrionales bacterium]|nr:RluA family pseudouridine synthase [Bdellovibrionales bacterium]